jgi:endonuclease/exonuclease/phosphatase (EEP) superfamily protein YafD
MGIEIEKIIIYVAGYLFMVFSILPLVRNDNWIFRIFEYPRFQKLVINAAIFSCGLLLLDLKTLHDQLFLIFLAVNILYLLYQIWPYTVFSRYQMKAVDHAKKEPRFKLMIFNVYQDNRDVDSCIGIIEAHHPDLILLVETDRWWKRTLDEKLGTRYKYQLSVPLENTYGMQLYSMFRLLEPQVKYLVQPDVPSIHTKVQLEDGSIFKLYGIHPQPPVPHENPRSTERDAEILIVAKDAVHSECPVIVAGDLNDVAWSYTTELFLKVSKLLDPRRGRGFFNTFHAHHWFLRWPLDHVFCSSHFELCALERLPDIGSDHFPILIEVQLLDRESGTNKRRELHADAEDKGLANKKILQAD